MTYYYVTTYLPKGLGASPAVSYEPVSAASGQAAIAQFTKRALHIHAVGPVAATVARPGEYPVAFYFEPRQTPPIKVPIPIHFRRGRSFEFRARMRAAQEDVA
ncbi:hypothetical protein OSH10_03370 [Kaistia defluvii]|uniref:hypothetical protein n=1 Tax=Kaistia defluvii TaxID=410841 RepID=UPI0022531D44|nr:hypothetical protein [Kaistia defluvii]MCX5517466.1 hypothetical protein [Kaistia defluvii]